MLCKFAHLAGEGPSQDGPAPLPEEWPALEILTCRRARPRRRRGGALGNVDGQMDAGAEAEAEDVGKGEQENGEDGQGERHNLRPACRVSIRRDHLRTSYVLFG